MSDPVRTESAAAPEDVRLPELDATEVECPECGAGIDRECFEPDQQPCSCCGWIGCRTIDVPPHQARLLAALKAQKEGTR